MGRLVRYRDTEIEVRGIEGYSEDIKTGPVWRHVGIRSGGRFDESLPFFLLFLFTVFTIVYPLLFVDMPCDRVRSYFNFSLSYVLTLWEETNFESEVSETLNKFNKSYFSFLSSILSLKS